MSECKEKMVVEICAESACDAVAKRVADGMKVVVACKEVADEYNKDHEGQVKWTKLKQAYYRASKCDTVTVSKKTPKVKELPNYTPKQVDEINALKKTCTTLREQSTKDKSTIDTLLLAMNGVDEENQRLKHELAIERGEEPPVARVHVTAKEAQSSIAAAAVAKSKLWKEKGWDK